MHLRPGPMNNAVLAFFKLFFCTVQHVKIWPDDFRALVKMHMQIHNSIFTITMLYWETNVPFTLMNKWLTQPEVSVSKYKMFCNHITEATMDNCQKQTSQSTTVLLHKLHLMLTIIN